MDAQLNAFARARLEAHVREAANTALPRMKARQPAIALSVHDNNHQTLHLWAYKSVAHKHAGENTDCATSGACSHRHLLPAMGLRGEWCVRSL